MNSLNARLQLQDIRPLGAIMISMNEATIKIDNNEWAQFPTVS